MRALFKAPNRVANPVDRVLDEQQRTRTGLADPPASSHCAGYRRQRLRYSRSHRRRGSSETGLVIGSWWRTSPAPAAVLACRPWLDRRLMAIRSELLRTSTNAVSAAINPTLPYDPVKSFAPVSLIGHSPYVLTINTKLPANSITELVALAKAKPGEIRNGTFGTESLAYLAGAWFSSLAGVTFNQITYRSTAQAVLDLVGDRIDMQFATLPPTVPLINERRIRALATTGAKRVNALPEVPTFGEQGMPDLQISLWMGIAAPAGTPNAIVSRLNREMVAVLALPKVIAVLSEQGFDAEPGTPEAMSERISRDVAKLSEVVEKTGIRSK